MDRYLQISVDETRKRLEAIVDIEGVGVRCIRYRWHSKGPTPVPSNWTETVQAEVVEIRRKAKKRGFNPPWA